GMKIGIITDLAVGVHPGGADAEILSEYLAPQASVGAPPDDYNQQGQDWSQPPWHPVRLAESGYKPWREMLATVLRNAGGVRVDHILGLFRLYWIPRMSPPTSGTYVAYDFEAMLGILALEAERAGAVVIGEDLGTMEPWIQDTLREKGFLAPRLCGLNATTMALPCHKIGTGPWRCLPWAPMTFRRPWRSWVASTSRCVIAWDYLPAPLRMKWRKIWHFRHRFCTACPIPGCCQSATLRISRARNAAIPRS